MTMADITDLPGQGIAAATNAATNAFTSTDAGATVATAASIGATAATAVTSTAAATAATALGVGAAQAAVSGALTTAATVGGEAAAAVGIGAAVGNAIPIPLIGAAIGAIIGGLTAFGLWLASATKETFNLTPDQADALLDFFELVPALSFMNVDKALNPTAASHLARYLMVASGRVPTGVKGNNGQLYNPVSDYKCDNPYMCQIDPDQPLTDERYIAPHYWQYIAAQRRGVPYVPERAINTPSDAAKLLAALRKHGGAVSGMNEFSGANAAMIGEEIRALRLLAGEDGPDMLLTAIFGVDVTVHQPVPWYEDPGWWVVGGLGVAAAGGAAFAAARAGRGAHLNALVAARLPAYEPPRVGRPQRASFNTLATNADVSNWYVNYGITAPEWVTEAQVHEWAHNTAAGVPAVPMRVMRVMRIQSQLTHPSVVKPWTDPYAAHMPKPYDPKTGGALVEPPKGSRTSWKRASSTSLVGADVCAHCKMPLYSHTGESRWCPVK